MQLKKSENPQDSPVRASYLSHTISLDKKYCYVMTEEVQGLGIQHSIYIK